MAKASSQTKSERRESKKRPRMPMHGAGLRNVLTIWQKRATSVKPTKSKKYAK